MTTVTLPDGSTASFPDDMSHDDMISVIKQHLSQTPQASAPAPPSGPMSAAQGWLQQITAAQQGTSPVVRDMQGNLNYNRLGNPIDTDAGPGYVDGNGKWQIVDPSRHVMLTDPATGQPGVFERNQATEESRASSLGRLASFGVMSGPSPPVGADTVAHLASGGGSTLAKVAASPLTKLAANTAAGYGAHTLGGLLGLSPEVSGMIGGMVGIGPHGAGEALQNFANWLNARAATAGAVAAPAAVPAAATYAVPGLLANTLAGTSGAAGYPYSTP